MNAVIRRLSVAAITAAALILPPISGAVPANGPVQPSRIWLVKHYRVQYHRVKTDTPFSPGRWHGDGKRSDAFYVKENHRLHNLIMKSLRIQTHERASANIPVEASWYGPGFYGHNLGCSGYGTLEPGTWGVANKTLPCGSVVTFRYGSATVQAPVIDRGPYVSGRSYDLTESVKNALGCPDICHLYANKDG